MANRELNLAVGAETTLASSATSGATSLSVTSSSGFPAVDFAVVLDPGDDSKREVVIVTNVSGTTWTVTRGQDGTSGAAHDSGAVVALVPVPSLWGDLHDRVEAHQHGGGTDGAAVDHGSLSGLGDFTADHGSAHDAHDHSAAASTIASADLADHNKATHDALTLDHGSLSGKSDDDHPQYAHVAAQVKETGGGQTVGGSEVTVNLDETDFAANCSLSANTLTVTRGGTFRASASVDGTTSGSPTGGTIRLKVNGTTIASDSISTGGGTFTGLISRHTYISGPNAVFFDLSDGDEITITAQLTGTGSGSTSEAWLYIERVG